MDTNTDKTKAEIDPLKVRVRAYLKLKKMSPGLLGQKAGVARWSVGKWVKEDDADILWQTRRKIARYMDIVE